MATQPARLEMVIFIGIPGAGKSTLFREKYAATHAHISMDNFRHHRHKRRRQQTLIFGAFGKGQSVVVDNTNLTVADRAALIAMARAVDARIVGVFFPSRVADSLARNARREGAARVPDVAIYAGAANLQHPSLAEGFDELQVARITDDGMCIEPWHERPADSPDALPPHASADRETPKSDTDEIR